MYIDITTKPEDLVYNFWHWKEMKYEFSLKQMNSES